MFSLRRKLQIIKIQLFKKNWSSAGSVRPMHDLVRLRYRLVMQPQRLLSHCHTRINFLPAWIAVSLSLCLTKRKFSRLGCGTSLMQVQIPKIAFWPRLWQTQLALSSFNSIWFLNLASRLQVVCLWRLWHVLVAWLVLITFSSLLVSQLHGLSSRLEATARWESM